MVEEDRYCVDILTQLAAARAALNGVAMQLLTHHAHGCVQQAIQSGEGEAALDELMARSKTAVSGQPFFYRSPLPRHTPSL